MYYLVNAMQSSSDVVGHIVSRHRSREAAEAAEARIQRATKRANGPTSYIPTLVVELDRAIDGWVYRWQLDRS